MTGQRPSTPHELVCLALRTLCDADAACALAVAVGDPGVDWKAVCRLADAERVAPLLSRALRPLPTVPAEVARRLRDAHHRAAASNLLLRRELTGVLQALDGAGIPALVLKGAALAETVYPNIALRPMQDLDLLLWQRDLPRALATLAGLGFAADRVEARTGTGAAYENEWHLHKQRGRKTTIEIHWSLFDSPHYQSALAMDWFWDTADTAMIADTPARMLGPEAQLLHLCGHLRLHHRGDELLWLYDVAQVIAAWHARIDWRSLLEQACRFDLVLSLRDVLGRVAVDWHAPVPDAVLHQLRALQPSRREARVFAWLTQPDRSVAQRLLVDLASLQSWPRRLAFAMINLFPSADYMRQRYRIRHPVLTPFYYPYRWLRALRGAR